MAPLFYFVTPHLLYSVTKKNSGTVICFCNAVFLFVTSHFCCTWIGDPQLEEILRETSSGTVLGLLMELMGRCRMFRDVLAMSGRLTSMAKDLLSISGSVTPMS